MIANPVAASHLAELDARYESHLAALRTRAEQLRERLAGDASAITERLGPVPDSGAFPGGSLLADTPLLAPDDGVPLGSDA